MFTKKVMIDLILHEGILAKSQKLFDAYMTLGSSSGKNPKGIAAAALYITANTEGLQRTQKSIASVYQIALYTLQLRIKELRRFAEKHRGVN
jgi:transcription initiation factor TFIIIB Brf1 subunit/transcription initiation factor TFIIB